MGRSRHRRGQRGVALSSGVALVSAVAVILAGAAFVATGGAAEERPPQAAPVPTVPTTPSPSVAAASKAPTPVLKKKKPKPAVRRGETLVEVYNNSGIHGLADRTSKRASGAGWNVVGSDNWYGTIPASTVYYPSRLARQARLLAHDLGIQRLKPAIAPMRFDRLTVILTGDYA